MYVSRVLSHKRSWVFLQMANDMMQVFEYVKMDPENGVH
jgi:hypothetical protein